jgi:acetyl coenzyme A synthetase (ADP forming)-like protein
MTGHDLSGLRSFFSPRSVAVLGVGRHGGVGAAIYDNLRAAFRGTVHAVNPHAADIAGHACHTAITDIGVDVDLAVIAVPAPQVSGAVDDCIRKGVSSILLITAGFSETGESGREREAEIRRRVRTAGIRVIGPNCLGTVNTDGAVRLNASFAAAFPPEGPVAFASQSGALGLAMLQAAHHLNIGVSNFASIGNSLDVSATDLLELWESDERTRVILLYLEGIVEPRRFLEVARRVSRSKPIVALKAGRSAGGARAAASHTGALAAGDALVHALLREAGIIRAATLEELFEIGAPLARQPLPAGNRVAVLTNAGGPGILAADACESAGLAIASLTSHTTDTLRSFLPATANVADPVDMIATASPEDYRRAIPLLLADPGVDAVAAMFTPLSITDTEDVARAIAEAGSGSAKPVLATFFGVPEAAALVAPVACYGFPESPIRALGRVAAYARWRATPAEAPPVWADIDRTAIRQLIESTASSGVDAWAGQETIGRLLSAAGIPMVTTILVGDEAAARDAASRCGYPVVLKGSGAQLLHKTETHAVFTDLEDETAMLAAYRHLAGREDVDRVIVQPMITGGVELFAGVSFDEAFGHLVACGAGGTAVELLRDTAQRLAPLSRSTVQAMLEEVRSVRLLRGFRGAPPLDEAGFSELVLRLSALLDVAPEIREVDLNPVIVTKTRVWVVDARIKVATPAPAPEEAVIL